MVISTMAACSRSIPLGFYNLESRFANFGSLLYQPLSGRVSCKELTMIVEWIKVPFGKRLWEHALPGFLPR